MDNSWIDNLSEQEAGAALKYLDGGIDGLSEEEATLLLPHVDKLKKAPIKQESLLNKVGKAALGGVGAALDFMAPANLAVPGLIEGARAVVGMIPGGERIGGISGEQASRNIQEGNIPGTNIPYSELSPSKLIENFTGKGSIQNEEYNQANSPLHFLTEKANQLGEKVSDITGSPLVGTAANLATAGLALHGLNRAAVKASSLFEKPTSKVETPQEEAIRKQAEQEAAAIQQPLGKDKQLPYFPENKEPILVNENGVAVRMSDATNIDTFRKAAEERAAKEQQGQPIPYEPTEPAIIEGESRRVDEGIPYKQEVGSEKVQNAIEEFKQREIDFAYRARAFEENKSTLSKEQAFIEQERLRAEQEQLDNVRKQLFEENTISEPSQTSLSIEKILGEGVKNRSPNMGKFGQGGSFTPFSSSKKTPTFEEFKKTLPENISEDIAKEVFDKHYGDITVSSPQNKALSKMGLPEVTSLRSVEDMIPRWQNESDISGNPVTRALRENFSSGGRMTAERTGNSFIDWNIENILGNVRDAQVKVKNVQNELKGEVKKLTGNLINKFAGGEKIFVDTMGKLLSVEGSKDNVKLAPEAESFAGSLRKSLDDLGVAIKTELESQGIKNFLWRPNYLAGVFTGPYRSVVTMTKDGKETILGVIAGKTKAESLLAVEAMRKQFPEANIPSPVFRKEFDSASTELGKRYAAANEILNVLKNDSELSSQFQDALQQYYAKSTSDYFGYKQHTKAKSGIIGSEGNVPWRTAKDNAYDLLAAQLSVIDHGYHWLAQQKTAKQLNALLADESINMPEAKRYVSAYMDHAYGQTKDAMAAANNLVSWAAESAGLAPSQLKEMSSIIRNFALSNTLGMSGGFIASQFIQVPQALAVSFTKAMEKNIVANPALASTVGKLDLINALTHNVDKVSKEGSYFLKYAKESGVIDPHLVEHTIHRKVIPTTGMSPIGKALAGSVNVLFKGMDIESQAMGKVFIEAPESWTRGAFYLTMAHYYKQAGYSLKEAAHLADKDTSVHFVDYSPQERAIIFAKMGEVGKFMSTVTTFKLNALNQLPTYANRGMYKTLLAAGMTMLAVSGISGLPGMDEGETVGSKLKENGLVENTPREWMLRNIPDYATFGPLSMTPELVGLPAMALHTKFSMGDVIPNSLMDFIFPLASRYGKPIEKTIEAIGTPTAENKAVALREASPGFAKYVIDKYSALTSREGITRDPGNLEGPGFRRNPVDWKMEALLAVPTQAEYKQKLLARQDKLNEQITTKRVGELTKQAIAYIEDGNAKEFDSTLDKLMKIDPDNGIKLLTTRLEKSAVARQLTVEEYLNMKLAEKANTVRGMERFKRFKEMQ